MGSFPLSDQLWCGSRPAKQQKDSTLGIVTYPHSRRQSNLKATTENVSAGVSFSQSQRI